MANKILKSITFPGLPDKYLIPQGAPNLQQWATYLLVEDLNEFTENGFYYCEGCSNVPTSGRNDDGYMIVCASDLYGGSSVAQVYLVLTEEDKAEMYFRTGFGSEGNLGFTEWSKAGGESGHTVAVDSSGVGNLTLSNANMTTSLAENVPF